MVVVGRAIRFGNANPVGVYGAIGAREEAAVHIVVSQKVSWAAIFEKFSGKRNLA